MAARKPKPTSQINLDFESQQRERWAAIRSLALPPSSMSIRIKYIIESIEGMGKDGSLSRSIPELVERWSCPPSTLRQTIDLAEKLGLIKVARGRRSPSGRFDSLILTNDIPGITKFNASQHKQRRSKQAQPPVVEPEPEPNQEDHQPTLGELVQATGIGNWRDTLASLEGRNISSSYVASLIQYWESNRQIWEKPEGVLYFRLLNAIESRPSDQNWPPPSKVEPPAQKTNDVLNECQQYKSGVDREKSQLAAQESEWGQKLDSLDGDALKALAASCMDLENDIYGRMWQKYRANPEPGIVRDKLLTQLSRRAETCSAV